MEIAFRLAQGFLYFLAVVFVAAWVLLSFLLLNVPVFGWLLALFPVVFLAYLGFRLLTH